MRAVPLALPTAGSTVGFGVLSIHADCRINNNTDVVVCMYVLFDSPSEYCKEADKRCDCRMYTRNVVAMYVVGAGRGVVMHTEGKENRIKSTP